ncbi:hemerythrin family protein [Kineobactrum salinum]|uniref:Hemerythrin family protein n=1 Tax=Kineobactrum salinum TaxID=2708301 RepID=A0A6C0U790_9GAMM|nr:hemerythrin family protein [Kineobactrum salinum]QIB65354.1 hemerythrin family protein [Kineobactrum salinum]
MNYTLWMIKRTSDILWQDAQHQVLFEILDLLAETDSGDEVLRRLHDYTEIHFRLEEHYMCVLEYPDREAHTQSHDRFREEIASLLEGGADDPKFRAAVATFLREWLQRHVFGVDKKLEAFILSTDVK